LRGRAVLTPGNRERREQSPGWQPPRLISTSRRASGAAQGVRGKLPSGAGKESRVMPGKTGGSDWPSATCRFRRPTPAGLGALVRRASRSEADLSRHSPATGGTTAEKTGPGGKYFALFMLQSHQTVVMYPHEALKRMLFDGLRASRAGQGRRRDRRPAQTPRSRNRWPGLPQAAPKTQPSVKERHHYGQNRKNRPPAPGSAG
jgi:hypothetical protein